MDYTREIVLNFIPDGNIPVVRVKQGDSSTRFIKATLTRGHEIYVPGAEQTILFREEKPDGTGVLMDSTYIDTTLNRYLVVNNLDGTVTIELVSQATACPGLCRCDLCFLQNEKAISTASFILDVEAAPAISGNIVSSDDFRTLINALEDVGKSSTTELSDMTDVALSGVANQQILQFVSESGKWVNVNISVFGFQTEAQVKAIVESYHYQTESDVNRLIAAYITALDGNNLEY